MMVKEKEFICPKCKKPMKVFPPFVSDVRCMNEKCWFYGINRSFD